MKTADSMKQQSGPSPWDQPEAEGTSRPMLVLAGIVAGLVICGCFVLVLVISSSSKTALEVGVDSRVGDVPVSPGEATVGSPQPADLTKQLGDSEQVNGIVGDRSKRRPGRFSSKASRHKDVYTVSTPGKTPRMIQSQ